MNGLIITSEWGDVLKGVEDAVLGRIIKALIDVNKGVDVDTSDMKPDALMAFNFMKPYVIQNREKYLNTVEKRKLAGAMGGKQRVANATNCKQVPPIEKKRREEKRIEENRIESGCASATARPRSIDDVKEYFQGKGYPEEEAEAFWGHYESNGWKVGKNPMRNWHAAVGNWMRGAQQYSGKGSGKKSYNQISDEYEQQKRKQSTDALAGDIAACIEADRRRLGADTQQGGAKAIPGCPF